MKKTRCFLWRLKAVSSLVLLMGLFACNVQMDGEIDLSGSWRFEIDSNDVGIAEEWYLDNLEQTIQLPGSMALNGKGFAVDYDTPWTGNNWSMRNPSEKWYENRNYKPYLDKDESLFPYWLVPEKYYAGAAWYQKVVDVPADWAGKTIELYLERCHWETRVWVDSDYVGMQNSLGTAHRYDLTGFLSKGKHRISICIDNRVKEINVGYDAHSVSDNTQSNWNGIVGDLKLIQKDPVYISDVQVFLDTENQIAKVELTVINRTGESQKAGINLQASSTSLGQPQKMKSTDQLISLERDTSTIVIEYPMGEDVRLWDEFNPNLYLLNVELSNRSFSDTYQVQFGVRDFAVQGKRFTINGRPIFLRGTLECAIFPLTGFPPTDVESWERILDACRAHGLNHLRFHSWCPPEAAFAAADKLGFYYQVEVSTWGTIGEGEKIDSWLYEESRRMIKEYGNHPSFCLMPYGNEPWGDKRDAYLSDFVKYWKSKDSRRLYTSGAGWPAIEENQYHNLPAPRIQQWAEELKSIINSEPPKTDYDWASRLDEFDRPVISHEIGQWCVYPNFKEVEKYSGVLKPTNFEIFRRSLEAHHMLHLADSFFMASGKLQALCYKAEIEAALRTPDLAGFQLLDLHDFPGQGTALVGVLDPFWEEKGYISPEEYSRFCNETVPLARFKKRVFTSGEEINIGLEVAHFGKKELQSIVPKWKIVDEDKLVILEGDFEKTDLTWGNGIKLGSINEKIEVKQAQKFLLEVEVAGFTNSWDFWIYPSILPEQGEDILLTQTLDRKALSVLAKGGKVLLTAKKGSVKEGKGGEVGIGFSSIFWNTAWTKGQKPHTLGILCDPTHEALSQFPTEYHSNWQWWDAMSFSSVISLEGLSSNVEPIVRVIDDWVTNRSLALFFEAKVGDGKILVSGVDFLQESESRPEARQLLYSLIKYMEGDKFVPAAQLSAEEISGLFL